MGPEPRRVGRRLLTLRWSHDHDIEPIFAGELREDYGVEPICRVLPIAPST